MPPKAPKPHQYKNLAYVDRKPKFLQNALSALGGGSSQNENEPDSERDPSPTMGELSEEGDDEAPQVIVLKEGKHLTREEADEEKKKLEADEGQKPPEPREKKTSTLSFSSGSTSKRKRTNHDEGSWEGIVKRVQNAQKPTSEVVKRSSRDNNNNDDTKDKKKQEKSKSSKKQKQKPNKGLLSFAEEE